MRGLLGLLFALLPSPALACAVCGAAAERNRMAFLGTTVLLSLLPLAMMAGGLWWIARRGRLAGEFEEREPVQAPTVSASDFSAAGPGAKKPDSSSDQRALPAPAPFRSRATSS